MKLDPVIRFYALLIIWVIVLFGLSQHRITKGWNDMLIKPTQERKK